MQRYHDALMRMVGLALVLLLFGGSIGLDIAHYGDPHKHLKVGPTIVAVCLGLFVFASAWQVSRFTYADQVAAVMSLMFLIGYPLRLVSHHVGWQGLARTVLIVIGGFVLALGRGKSDDELPMAKFRQRAEAKGLPRLNRRRAKRGLPPVASFDQARKEKRTS